MKKLFVAVFMLAASFTFASAQQFQQNMSVEERAKAQDQRMENLLSLNADQKTKMKAINLDLAKQQDTKMQGVQGDREKMRAIMQEIDKMRDDKYKTLLTADQFKKYTDDKAQRQQRGPGGQGQGQGQRQRNN